MKQAILQTYFSKKTEGKDVSKIKSLSLEQDLPYVGAAMFIINYNVNEIKKDKVHMHVWWLALGTIFYLFIFFLNWQCVANIKQ